MINYEQFSALDLRVATVAAAERVEGSDKLLKLQIDLGDPLRTPDGQGLGSRQIVAGIGKAYEPDVLVGSQIIVVVNLEPRMLMGLESNGMLLAARDEDGLPVLLRPEHPVSPGSKIN